MQLSVLITESEEFVFIRPSVKVGIFCGKQSQQLLGYRSLTVEEPLLYADLLGVRIDLASRTLKLSALFSD